MYPEQWRGKGITLFETCFVPAGLQGDIAHATKLRRDSEYNLRHRTSPHSSGLSWTCSWPSPSFGSGYRVCRGRCRIQLAVTLLDSSGTERALHCDADMVRPVVGARHVKFLSGPAGRQGPDTAA